MTATDALLTSGRFRIVRSDHACIRSVTRGPGAAAVTTWLAPRGISWCSCGSFDRRCRHARALARVAPRCLVKAAGLENLLR